MTQRMTQRLKIPFTKRAALKTPQLRATKFTGGLVALSLAVASFSATPARADQEDVALALGGLLTLFVIGKAIDNAGDKPSKVTVHRQPVVPPHVLPRTVKKGVTSHPKSPLSKPRQKSAAFNIPNKCVTTARDSKRRAKTVALENCVMKNRRSARALPSACEIRVNTARGRKHAYELGCLTNFGYRVTRG